jgi:hypothetical protein
LKDFVHEILLVALEDGDLIKIASLLFHLDVHVTLLNPRDLVLHLDDVEQTLVVREGNLNLNNLTVLFIWGVFKSRNDLITVSDLVHDQLVEVRLEDFG